MKSKILVISALLLILSVASVLRFYRLGVVPYSITWDEAAVGYNGWAVANFGRDEWGNFLPLVFKSFEDDKHPVHIYFTALSVKTFGLSEFATRLPSAVFGVLNVVLIFYLARIMLKSELTAISAATILALSPYSIHFSRFNHELQFVLFFFMSGLLLFFYALRDKPFLLPVSALSFGVTFIAYHSAKVVVPAMVASLAVFYFRDLLRIKMHTALAGLVFCLFAWVVFLNPALLGFARARQTSVFTKERVRETYSYQKYGNELLGKVEVAAGFYVSYFDFAYLFVSGDKNARLSAQSSGQFYWLDSILLSLGVIFLLLNRSRAVFVLMIWALLGPMPASLSSDTQHASRSMFMFGSWHLIAAYGLSSVVSIFSNYYLRVLTWAMLASFILFETSNFLRGYYGEFATRYAIDWQYGMKQIVEFVKNNPQYTSVYMTDVRSQPYIFFLYYLKVPPDELQEGVVYNHTSSRSYNLIEGFSGYYFGVWNPVESFPHPGVLYVVTPSQYDGLKYKNQFQTKLKIEYPNGTDAFFLVSGS